jgi:calcium-dependent protein kinase
MSRTFLLKKNWMIKQKKGSIKDDYMFRVGKELGSGSFGIVELGVHKLTKQERAIKKIPKHKVSEPQ